jgi:tRNA modification GTPase
MKSSETIAAISTPPGRGGIGVVRLSGEKAFEIALAVFKKNDGDMKAEKIESHKAYYGRVIDPDSGNELDEALVLFMKAPRTYTCEDMVEISLHGSPVILERVLEILIAKSARLAEPGEFTKQAFLNKRLDLVQAEAVAELINSKSLLESQLATKRVKGELSRHIDLLKDKMIGLLSEFEARIDFPEEGLAFEAEEAIRKKFGDIKDQL